MMIGERHENSRACLLVACDQLVGIPIEQRPLRAELFVSEARCRPVMIEVILVLALPFYVHIACIPVSSLGDTLRSPVRPDSKLGVAIPIRCFVFEQGIPRRFKGTVAGKIGNRRLQRHIVPCASCYLEWRRIVVPSRLLPVGPVQFCLDDLAVCDFVKDPLLWRQRTEGSVVLSVLIEAWRQAGLTGRGTTAIGG